ncbi:hypothetical protein [Neomoorella thermoacetica]|uniref:hypothetical protein n=1 Tax=Neomoorella thermoacetica TaxID=1525 RepID=UPI0030D3C60B
MKRFAGQKIWNSNQIEYLKEAIENHGVENQRIWLQKLCPVSSKDASEEKEKRILAKQRDLRLAILRIRRGEQSVCFYPDPVDFSSGPLGLKEPNPERGPWFQIWFDIRGYLLTSIGFPWSLEGITAEGICAAMYAILDLFTQPQVKECYLDCLWEGGSLGSLPGLINFPVL